MRHDLSDWDLSRSQSGGAISACVSLPQVDKGDLSGAGKGRFRPKQGFVPGNRTFQPTHQ